MSICRARLHDTSNALMLRMSGKQTRLQVPPKLYRGHCKTLLHVWEINLALKACLLVILTQINQHTQELVSRPHHY